MDDFERKELKKILDLLTLDSLTSLTDTVTGRVVTAENKEEAIKAIILFTRNSEELLRRRKVRRENLYQYLAMEGHVEHPAAEKSTILKKILKLWELRRQGKDLKDVGDTGFSLPQPLEKTDSPQVGINGNKPTLTNDTQTNKKTTTRDQGQELAIQFATWFYKLLETLVLPATDWGPQHFWNDVKLTIQYSEQNQSQEMTIEGSQLVSDKLQSMIIVDQLYFNPNISDDSVKSRQDPHGLVVVIVCGTVHRKQNYLGIFEQSFGLIRDPTQENNWKIKFSKLLLKASLTKGHLETAESRHNELESPP